MKQSDNAFNMKISAGLGEEVIADIKKEKLIKSVEAKLSELIKEGASAEHMSREVINFILKKQKKKDKNYNY